ncbi:glutamate receptor ionotropic, kainate 5 isoform X3 [Channa argus]|uniref:glutamate receptor ionotropic, kainate 5 isoform X3 n=1 Tax=Channa argus TaxID=215402 RepID=UPI0035223D68
MPALPALLLSIHFFSFLLVNMPPRSLSQAPLLSSVRMAAILDDQSVCGRGERLALALARENINSVMEGPARARVEVDIYELQKDSQYDTTDTMCQILPKGVVSVIGPASSPASGSTVSHICGEKEIPHVKIGPEETPRLPYLRFASVTLYPSNEDLSLAIGAILRSFSYPSASLVCAKAECLLRLEELVRHFLISRETLSIRMLDDNLDPTSLLKEIRDDKVATIIIDANASVSYLILKKASELGMTSAFYKYILTTMLSSALMFDAVHVVVGAVRELNRSQEIGVKPLSCTSPQIWQHGTSLMNYLRMVEYDGLTGRVEFNSKGQRTNYTLRILEKHRGGHKEIGIWYSNNTLAMNSTSLDINVSETLANKSLIVTTILENPYVMRKNNYQDFQGNDQYEGFCVDMLRELADILKFSFKIKLVDDGLYGAPEPNGSWTGMVGELINRKADLAVAGFTITSEREKVIDFSKPFMTLGISILYRVQLGRKPGYFSFLDPFSPAVWLFMLLAYLAVSCVLFLAARLSPYEWYNPHPCLRERRDMLENQYTLGNSLWFPVGGFMQQGSEIMPRALSTRCVSGVWWAFTLIIISSYTANLAAFLTVQRMEVPIESPDDLADQTNIEYGTIQGGSTMTFFMNSRYQTYQRMWNYMYSKQPSVFVKSTEEGIARVINSKYAFLMESTMNEYHRGLNCNLTQIGGLLDTKGYGIGMPLGSPFRDEITLAILQLQENNRLEILKRRWWEGGQCPKEEDHRAKGLGMENIGGIFVVLICGLIIAVFVAIMEFVWSTRRSAETDEVCPHTCPRRPHRHTPVSVCQEMITEFRNAVSCKKSSRMRRRRPLSNAVALRHPTRIALGAPRPLRLVREMRLSNGKLYSGTGPLTGGTGGGAGGTGPSDLGPGPQRILDDPLGANTTTPPPATTPVILPARSCTHVRICQECRRIQSLRSGSSIGSTTTRIPPSSAPLPRLPPPPPPSSSNTDSEGGGGPSPRRLHHSPPTHTPRPIPPPQSSNTTDVMAN